MAYNVFAEMDKGLVIMSDCHSRPCVHSFFFLTLPSSNDHCFLYLSHGMHNRENRPKKGGICVANHTSPIDIVILANDGCYAMVSHADFIRCVRHCVSVEGLRCL